MTKRDAVFAPVQPGFLRSEIRLSPRLFGDAALARAVWTLWSFELDALDLSPATFRWVAFVALAFSGLAFAVFVFTGLAFVVFPFTSLAPADLAFLDFDLAFTALALVAMFVFSALFFASVSVG